MVFSRTMSNLRKFHTPGYRDTGMQNWLTSCVEEAQLEEASRGLRHTQLVAHPAPILEILLPGGKY